MWGISPNNLDVLLEYLGGQHDHLRRQVVLFKPRKNYEACVKTQYMDNMCNKKGK